MDHSRFIQHAHDHILLFCIMFHAGMCFLDGQKTPTLNLSKVEYKFVTLALKEFLKRADVEFCSQTLKRFVLLQLYQLKLILNKPSFLKELMQSFVHQNPLFICTSIDDQLELIKIKIFLHNYIMKII